jgi:hypothetical protein
MTRTRADGDFQTPKILKDLGLSYIFALGHRRSTISAQRAGNDLGSIFR